MHSGVVLCRRQPSTLVRKFASWQRSSAHRCSTHERQMPQASVAAGVTARKTELVSSPPKICGCWDHQEPDASTFRSNYIQQLHFFLAEITPTVYTCVMPNPLSGIPKNPGMRVAFKLKETAQMLGISDNTVRRLAARKLLRPLRYTRHLLFSAQEIERFLHEAG